MIPMTDAAIAVQTQPGSVVRYVRAESWLDGVLLADDIPIVSGVERVDRSGRIHERVSLTIPKLYQGVTWTPMDDPEHPLQAMGQRLRVMLGVGLTGSTVEWIQRGEFLIDSCDASDPDSVTVEAAGLLALVDEAKLLSPYQPSGTLKSTLRGLIEPALTVSFASDLTDRAVPSGINYDEDRLGAVLELLDAWPAEASVTNDGYLYVHPPITGWPNSNFQVTTGNRIAQAGSSAREDTYNCVVARGTAADGAQVQGVAYVTTGPMRYPGPFSPLPVPKPFASPLLTTVAQCKAAALTVRNRMLRQNTQPIVADILPLINAQGGDVVRVEDDDDSIVGDVFTTLESFTLPYNAGGGSMRVSLVEVPTE